MTKPDFFIVGAPKCGTTALCHYLLQHPDIFIPAAKEIHYFAKDYPRDRYVNTPGDYAELFKSYEYQICGEASVWYLFSESAAAEIHQFNPAAKIIIMLRKPREYIESRHNQAIFCLDEDQVDIQQAVNLETERLQGRAIPENNQLLWSLFYAKSTMFHEQISRYLQYFPREQIHIILFDDFIGDTKKAYSDVLAFLGASRHSLAEFEPVNARKTIRSVVFQKLITNLAVRTIGRMILGDRLALKLGRAAMAANTAKQEAIASQFELPGETRERLNRDIAALEQLVGKDLSAWRVADVARGSDVLPAVYVD